MPAGQVRCCLQAAALGTEANVPFAQGTQMASRVCVPGIKCVPGGHVVWSKQASWFVLLLNVPSAHALHTWSLLSLPSTDTKNPAPHCLCRAHVWELSAVENVPGAHALHSRSVDGVSVAETNSPGTHTSSEAHAGMAAVRKVLWGQPAHTLSLETVGGCTWYCPGGHTVTFSHAPFSPAENDTPCTHGAHLRSAVAFGGATTPVPGMHVVTGLHRLSVVWVGAAASYSRLPCAVLHSLTGLHVTLALTVHGDRAKNPAAHVPQGTHSRCASSVHGAASNETPSMQVTLQPAQVASLVAVHGCTGPSGHRVHAAHVPRDPHPAIKDGCACGKSIVRVLMYAR